MTPNHNRKSETGNPPPTVRAPALDPTDRAELYRLKGELVLQTRSKGQQAQEAEEAQACFQQALDIARRQGAKALELRAVMSLCRLWQKQGRTEEARQMLAKVYNWFIEGFKTKDLLEAKALLEGLS